MAAVVPASTSVTALIHNRLTRWFSTLLAAVLAAPCAVLAAGVYDASGVQLGDSEQGVKKVFPGIRCKPLEWKSQAADRRCDDAGVAFAGIEARITFYLKAGAVRAFDVRFDRQHVDKIAEHLRRHYGKPLSEGRETIVGKNSKEREIFKMLWEHGSDRARLSSLSTAKRASLSVSRGDFDEEIYRIGP